MKYAHVFNAVFNQPWAIMPDKLAAIAEIVSLRVQGGKLSEEEIAAKTAGKPGRKKAVRGAVAVLPIYGVLNQRMNMMDEMSGGTSTEELSAEFDAMVNDPNVGAIVLDVDSPGGSVYGIQELGDKIYAARGTKPIIAVANSLAASAAYWLASQADELVVTPGGEVGSIGVFAEHVDASKWEEANGIKTSLISSGKYKVEGNPYEPLQDEARAFIQKRVSEYYDAFVSAVAQGRNESKSAVRNGFGEGRVVGAKEAVSLNMADRVATFEQVVGDLTARQTASKTNARAAMADLSILEAELS